MPNQTKSSTPPYLPAITAYQGHSSKAEVGIGYIGSWAAGVGKVDYPDVKFDYVELPPMFGSEHKFVADAGWGKVVSARHQAQQRSLDATELLDSQPR
jgi:hypothetical protein